LIGQNGDLLAEINELLTAIDPTLGILGGEAKVSATLDIANVRSAVSSILTSRYADGAVTFDLETGVVTIDLAKLNGGNLNNLPVNTELLTDAMVNEILAGIADTVSGIADTVVSQVRDVLRNAKVNISADLSTDVVQSTVNLVCEDVITGTITEPVLGPVLGNTANPLLQTILNGLGLGGLGIGSLTDGVLDTVGSLVA